MTREKFLARERRKLEKAWKALTTYHNRMSALGLPPLVQHELVDRVEALIRLEMEAAE